MITDTSAADGSVRFCPLGPWSANLSSRTRFFSVPVVMAALDPPFHGLGAPPLPSLAAWRACRAGEGRGRSRTSPARRGFARPTTRSVGRRVPAASTIA